MSLQLLSPYMCNDAASIVREQLMISRDEVRVNFADVMDNLPSYHRHFRMNHFLLQVRVMTDNHTEDDPIQLQLAFRVLMKIHGFDTIANIHLNHPKLYAKYKTHIDSLVGSR